MRELRSLMVDIYPPNFDEGLESALSELLARAGDAACDVELDVDARRLVPEARRGCSYRAAQEALRNTSTTPRRAVRLEVVAARRARRARPSPTTGAGSTPTRPRAARAEGHIGLKTLRGLVDRRRRPSRRAVRARVRARRSRVEVPGYDHPIRVVVVDDHAVVRGGLEQLLSTADDIELVGRPRTARRRSRPCRESPTSC